jgi:hypothetical protein
MSRDDFLRWEERQPACYEFDGFQPVAMTGGSANHARIQRYVILQQDQQAATTFSRRDDLWVADILTGDAILAMPEIGVDLPLPDCYRGVEFPPPEPTEA